MNYPIYIEVNGKKYKINTDFRIAIKCDEIARDKTIDDVERAYAVIYLLLGDEGLDDYQNHNQIMELLQKYLACGKEVDNKKNENAKPDMSFNKDMPYIWASFMSDYKMDLDTIEEMHWWKFMDLINGLSNSELGDCCILNKIRNLRNINPSKIKDSKERQKIVEQQKLYSLEEEIERTFTKEEEDNIDEFNKLAGL